jgi:hypothetical protein
MEACMNRLGALPQSSIESWRHWASRHHQTLPPEPVARAAFHPKRLAARGCARLEPRNVTTSSPEPSAGAPIPRAQGLLLVPHEKRGSLLVSRSLAMATALHPPAIKLVGSNGQISLGKQYAGRHVLVEEREPGVWIIRTATVIPDNERWLYEPAAAADLQAAMAWSTSHPPADADLDETLTRLGCEEA